MLGVRERIDGRDAAEFRELLDIALRESSDDDAVQHSSHHARGILDWFAAAELNVVAGEEHHRSSQLAYPHFKGHARAGRGLREHQCPTSISQRMRSVRTPVPLNGVTEKDNALNFVATQRLDGKKVFHGEWAATVSAGISKQTESRQA